MIFERDNCEFEIKKTYLLACTIAQIYPLEWIKYTMYVEDDIYAVPPGVGFRFCGESKEIYKELNTCLKHFRGNINWILYKDFYSRKNYVIEPEEFYNIRKTYFEKKEFVTLKNVMKITHYKKICNEVIKDIPLLCEHISKYFQLK